jgi:hypothetical protein
MFTCYVKEIQFSKGLLILVEMVSCLSDVKWQGALGNVEVGLGVKTTSNLTPMGRR